MAPETQSTQSHGAGPGDVGASQSPPRFIGVPVSASSLLSSIDTIDELPAMLSPTVTAPSTAIKVPPWSRTSPPGRENTVSSELSLDSVRSDPKMAPRVVRARAPDLRGSWTRLCTTISCGATFEGEPGFSSYEPVGAAPSPASRMWRVRRRLNQPLTVEGIIPRSWAHF